VARSNGTNRWHAVLTGASGGIGAAIAAELAPRCAVLILVGRQRAALEALQRGLQCPSVHIICGDLTEPATLDDIERTGRALGGINLLINNAGVSDFHAFATQAPAAIESMLATNLLAPMLLTRRLLPALMAQPSAQVVNVGSVFGAIGFPGFAAYCAAKSGLKGFSQALRRELSDSTVTVRYFAPRATRTSINSDAVNAMNCELNTAEDTPRHVAVELLRFLDGKAWQRTLGAKERFFSLLNAIFPGLPDGAIRGQLPIIRKHLPK
jgi:short-subunit dehydrogenase